MSLINSFFRKLLIASLLVFPFFCFSQLNTEADLYENNIKEVNITAREYANGVVIKEVKVKELINENGKRSKFITFKQDGTIKNLIKSYYSDEGRIKIDTSFNDDGSTNRIYISISNLKKNIITNYQIVPPNDTVATQIRYLNKKGKDSLLMNTIQSNNFVGLKWDYNNEGMLEKSTSYFPDGRIRSIQIVKYDKEKDCKIITNDKGQIRERTCFSNGEEVTRYYYNRTGYLYGIKMETTHLGKKVIKRNEGGLIKSLSYFDRRENLLSEIVFEYVL